MEASSSESEPLTSVCSIRPSVNGSVQRTMQDASLRSGIRLESEPTLRSGSTSQLFPRVEVVVPTLHAVKREIRNAVASSSKIPRSSSYETEMSAYGELGEHFEVGQVEVDRRSSATSDDGYISSASDTSYWNERSGIQQRPQGQSMQEQPTLQVCGMVTSEILSDQVHSLQERSAAQVRRHVSKWRNDQILQPKSNKSVSREKKTRHEVVQNRIQTSKKMVPCCCHLLLFTQEFIPACFFSSQTSTPGTAVKTSNH